MYVAGYMESLHILLAISLWSLPHSWETIFMAFMLSDL